MLKQNHKPFTLEITVLSAEGLKTATFFSNRIRPFITFSTDTSSPYSHTRSDKEQCHVYTTKADDEGGTNPIWGDKFHVPIDTTFFENRYSAIYLQLYTKRLIVGRAQLGWCQIPAYDIGAPPVGAVRFLSYRLRARDGSRGHGIVNLAVKLEGLVPVAGQRVVDSGSPTVNTCQAVIGIPVDMFPLPSYGWDE